MARQKWRPLRTLGLRCAQTQPGRLVLPNLGNGQEWGFTANTATPEIIRFRRGMTLRCPCRAGHFLLWFADTTTSFRTGGAPPAHLLQRRSAGIQVMVTVGDTRMCPDVPAAIGCGPYNGAIRHQYTSPEPVEILHGRTVRVLGGVQLQPKQSLHNQAVRIYNDGLVRTSNAQPCSKLLDSGNEIRERLAARAVNQGGSHLPQ